MKNILTLVALMVVLAAISSCTPLGANGTSELNAGTSTMVSNGQGNFTSGGTTGGGTDNQAEGAVIFDKLSAVDIATPVNAAWNEIDLPMSKWALFITVRSLFYTQILKLDCSKPNAVTYLEWNLEKLQTAISNLPIDSPNYESVIAYLEFTSGITQLKLDACQPNPTLSQEDKASLVLFLTENINEKISALKAKLADPLIREAETKFLLKSLAFLNFTKELIETNLSQ